MNHISHILWTEKYRPQVFDDLVVPTRVMNKIKSGASQNMLLYGPPGSGKSTVSKILGGEDCLFINCSLDTGIETVRGHVVDYCATQSLMDDGAGKVVVFDEFDGATPQMQNALRGVIEKFASNVTFVATCNYFNKIPDPMKSRFECINFDFQDDEKQEMQLGFMKRVHHICAEEGLTIEPAALKELVLRKFPDMRSMINSLQGYFAEGLTEITAETVKKYHGIFKDVYDLVFNETSPAKVYSYMVGNYSHNVSDIIFALGQEFIEYLRLEKPGLEQSYGNIVYEVNQHSYQLNFVIDPVVTMLSLVHRIQQIVNKQ